MSWNFLFTRLCTSEFCPSFKNLTSSDALTHSKTDRQLRVQFIWTWHPSSEPVVYSLSCKCCFQNNFEPPGNFPSGCRFIHHQQIDPASSVFAGRFSLPKARFKRKIVFCTRQEYFWSYAKLLTVVLHKAISRQRSLAVWRQSLRITVHDA